jgi:DNA-binding NarL/FixJ family response regulator
MTAPWQVVIVEDDDEVLALLEVLFDLDDRFDVVGTAASGDTGTALVAELEPDAVILDLELPRVSGITAIPMLRTVSPDTRVVVFSGFADPMTLLEVLRLGADAYLDKAAAWSELLPAVASLFDQPSNA